jgi:hypothetical protein
LCFFCIMIFFESPLGGAKNIFLPEGRTSTLEKFIYALES